MAELYNLVDINGNIIEENIHATEDSHGLMCPEDKIKLATIEQGANNYIHPSYTARTGKPTANATPAFGDKFTISQITSDATGHVTGATDRTITIPSTLSNGTNTAGLIKTSSTVTSNSGYTACPVISGVPYYKDTNTTYSAATTSAAGLMSATDKTKLDGIAAGANAYTHPSYTARTGKPTANATPAFGGTFTVSQITSDATGHVTGATDRTITIPSTLSNGTTAGLIKTSSTVTSNSGYTACPVISGVPYYKDYTLSSFGITATATELNYIDGVTSDVQTQLNEKATKSYVDSAISSAMTVDTTYAV